MGAINENSNFDLRILRVKRFRVIFKFDLVDPAPVLPLEDRKSCFLKFIIPQRRALFTTSTFVVLDPTFIWDPQCV